MIVDIQVDVEAAADPSFWEAAKKAGLDGVVLTAPSHFPVLDAHRALAEAQGLSIFAGARLATDHGTLLALLPDPTAPLADGWAEKAGDVFVAASVIDEVEERGGVTIALRPYDREVAHPMGDQVFQLVGLTACEVQNGKLPSAANDLALEAASNLDVPMVGSSSAGVPSELGTAATLFRRSATSEAELVDLIRHGDCWPLSFQSQLPRRDAAPRAGAPAPSRGGGGGGGGREDGERRRGRGRRRGGGAGRGGERGPERAPGEERRETRSPEAPRSEPSRGRGRGPSSGGMPGLTGSGGGGSGAGRAGGGRRGRRSGPGGGPGGGRRASGPVAEDIGNRRTPEQRLLDEDAGNRWAPEAQPVAEDIGNRWAPEPDDVDDGIGNR